MFPISRICGLAATVTIGAALAGLPAAARDRAAAVVGDGIEKSFDCGGGAANVSGANNRIVIGGRCHILNVSGDGNQIEVELQAGRPINVMGSANRIVYRLVDGRSPPMVNVIGADNRVEAGVPVAANASAGGGAPAAEAIEVTGDSENRDIDCTGKLVALRGDSNRLRLTGGCTSLVVSGDSNVVEVEMRPGGSILVSGDRTSITYTVKGEGPAPIIRVSGSDSEVGPGTPRRP